MSVFRPGERYEDRLERQREERREYEGDVYFELWRAGHVERFDPECVYDCYAEGRLPEECAEDEVRRAARSRRDRDHEDPAE